MAGGDSLSSCTIRAPQSRSSELLAATKERHVAGGVLRNGANASSPISELNEVPHMVQRRHGSLVRPAHDSPDQ